MHLKKVEGLCLDEVAKEFGYTEGATVKSQKNYVAFKNLLGKIARKYEEHEEYNNLRNDFIKKLVSKIYGYEIKTFNLKDLDCISIKKN
jgi:hypothetical protein